MSKRIFNYETDNFSVLHKTTLRIQYETEIIMSFDL